MKLKWLKSVDEHMLEVLRGASIAMLLKIIGALLAFAFNVVLARLLGAEGAGIYFLALSITTIASVVARFGLDNTLLRFVAAGASEQNWPEVKGVYNKAMVITLPLSMIITLIIGILAHPLSVHFFDKPELGDSLQWMSLAILPLSLLSLYSEMLRGLKKIPASLSLRAIFLPAVNMAVLLSLASTMNTQAGAISYLIATVSTAVLGGMFWFRYAHKILKTRGEFEWNTLKKSCIPNYGVALLHKAVLPWLPIILLGLWASNEDVGLYSAAARTAMLVSFILLAVNSIAAPKFSALSRQNNIAALVKISQRTTWITTLASLPLVLPMLLFPETIMGVFGQEYRQAWILLVILAATQFVNVIFGPVGYLLVMTGNESLQRNSFTVSIALLVVFLIILIPICGAVGAAIASTISIVAFNIVSYIFVRSHLGFSTI